MMPLSSSTLLVCFNFSLCLLILLWKSSVVSVISARREMKRSSRVRKELVASSRVLFSMPCLRMTSFRLVSSWYTCCIDSGWCDSTSCSE